MQSIRSIIEATVESKTAAHVMMLWNYKLLNQEGTQQTDFPPDATTTFSQQLALPANEVWEKPSASTPGNPTNFQIPAKPPLMMPPLSMKQLDRSAPIIPRKDWNVRSLTFQQAEGQKGPKASTLKPEPLICDLLLLFLSLQNNSGTSSFSISQAC
jgi:hypothetical protein